MSEMLWEPSLNRIKNSNIISFMKYVSELTGKEVSTYKALYDWSINNIEEFWKSIWVLSGVISHKEFTEVLQSKSMFESKWFVGAELNFAENLLKYKDDHIALISVKEHQPVKKISYKELYNDVGALCKLIESFGLKPGDRAAAYINNIPEAVIAMLASTAKGLIWSSASLEFGVPAINDRFNQIKPSILFIAEGYSYNGKYIDCTNKINEIIKCLPELKALIIIPYKDKVDLNKINFKTGVYDFNKVIEDNYKKDSKINFVPLPFDQTIYIMFSSGTTGKPKCIMHSAGGTLLQHFKELSLHTDLNRHDVITFLTTAGWMMWNWLISSLMIGSSIVLIDGSFVYPNSNFLWDLVDELKISILGVTPKFLSICEKEELRPTHTNTLTSLKTILSTGSPLFENNFKWVYNNVKKDVLLSSISGGTDIISCFMLGCPILPVHSEEIQCRGLGMAVEAFDDYGDSIKYIKGELVCTKPFPAMPVGFWNDEKKENFYNTYFSFFPGVWRHGDYIEITLNEGVIVYGRSDAVLNPGGTRIGTSEIYNIVEKIPEVTDSLVIAQKYGNDERMILFVVLDKKELDLEFKNYINNKIKEESSPRYIPELIIEVNEVPKTINNKKVELAVTKIFNGEKPENINALLNPDSLEEYKKIYSELIKKGLSVN